MNLNAAFLGVSQRDEYTDLPPTIMYALWSMMHADLAIVAARRRRADVLFSAGFKLQANVPPSVIAAVRKFFDDALTFLDAFGMVPLDTVVTPDGYRVPLVPEFASGGFVWRMNTARRVDVMWRINSVFVRADQRDGLMLPVFIETEPDPSMLVSVHSRAQALYQEFLQYQHVSLQFRIATTRGANPITMLSFDHQAHNARAETHNDTNDTTEFMRARLPFELLSKGAHVFEDLDSVSVARMLRDEWTNSSASAIQKYNNSAVPVGTQHEVLHAPELWRPHSTHAPITPNMPAAHSAWREAVESVFGVAYTAAQAGASAVQHTLSVTLIENAIRAMQNVLSRVLAAFCEKYENALQSNTPKVLTYKQYARAVREQQRREAAEPSVDAIVAKILQQAGGERVSEEDVRLRVQQSLKATPTPKSPVVKVRWNIIDLGLAAEVDITPGRKRAAPTNPPDAKRIK